MILPGKHISADRSLVVVGGDILAVLGRPSTVSEIWDAVRAARAARERATPLAYDWFVLALTFLFAIAAIRVEGDKIIADKPS
ncbi:ABC-three component system middle component 6 [Bradyrhizobium sp. USDA 3650]